MSSNVFHKKISSQIFWLAVLTVTAMAVFFVWRSNGFDARTWAGLFAARKNAGEERIDKKKMLKEALSEASKKQSQRCWSELPKLNDEQLMDNLFNYMDRAGEIEPSTGEKRITTVHKWLVNYLSCQVAQNRDEDYYNKAKQTIQNLRIRDESKQSSLESLERSFAGSLVYQMVMGQQENMCYDELPSQCLRDMGGDSASEGVKRWCKDLCYTIDRYERRQNEFEAEVLEFKNWSDDVNIRERQYKVRSTMAYRIGGKKAALRVCDNLFGSAQEDQENCREHVDKLEKIKNDEFCKDIKWNFVKLICG